MGSHGAGRVALLAVAMHPGVFSGVGGHSPAVGSGDDAIAARLSGQSGPVRLDVGEKDALRPGVEHFASRVKIAGGSADLVEAPGGHDRAYWRIAYVRVPQVLRLAADLAPCFPCR